MAFLGEVDKGVAQFERLMNNPLYGRQPAAATNAGRCLRDQKRHADSVRYFETALAKQPDWLEAVAQLADVQITLEKPAAARKAVDNYLSMRNNAAVLVIGVRHSGLYRRRSSMVMIPPPAFIAATSESPTSPP